MYSKVWCYLMTRTITVIGVCVCTFDETYKNACDYKFGYNLVKLPERERDNAYSSSWKGNPGQTPTRKLLRKLESHDRLLGVRNYLFPTVNSLYSVENQLHLNS